MPAAWNVPQIIRQMAFGNFFLRDIFMWTNCFVGADIRVGVHTQGIRATEGTPNPHLFQSIAVLAGEMGYVDEARRWFREGTRTIKGKQSHALWHAWAILEAAKVACL